MLCLTIRRRLLTYCFGLFFGLAFCFFCGSSFSYATNGPSVTFEQGVSYRNTPTSIFPDCDSSCIRSYSFVKIEVSSVSYDYNPVRFYFYNNNQNYYFFVSYNNPVQYVSIYSETEKILLQQNTTPTSTFTLTLVDSVIPAPSGSLSITENGTFDVTSYSEAVVDVSQEVIPGDYHDDLIMINNSILICAGTCLVIYFFYCIYRMIIRSVS